MGSNIIPLKVPGGRWAVPTEFDHQLQSIEQCMEFLHLTAETLLAEAGTESRPSTLSSKDKAFYETELPLVRSDVEDSLRRLRDLLGRVNTSPNSPQG
ncbi:MAG: hypothetical protein AAFY34_04215 [Pseudomonadota bacterium]